MLAVVTGTGTEVGKTWVSAAVASVLRATGVPVAARKPVQSFAPGEDPTDADVLAIATGEPPTTVCPDHRWLRVPLAPPMAAEVLGLPPFTIADLAAEVRQSIADGVDVVLVEGAGGVRSPLAADGDTVDLVAALRPDAVVLVADSGLGTINLVRLSTAALHPWPLVVFLNRFDAHDDLHARNLDWLRTREGLEVVTAPEALAHTLMRR